jgi:hypothetical protein
LLPAKLNKILARAGKGEGDYDQQAFATFFPDDIGTVTTLMDDFVDALRSDGGPDKSVVDQYISYISHYRCRPWAALFMAPSANNMS